MDNKYNIRGAAFRPDIGDPGYKSEGLDEFLSELDNIGHRNPGDPFSLNQRGVELLEKMVLISFAEDPKLSQRFAGDAGLDLNTILQKHIREYLGVEEESI